MIIENEKYKLPYNKLIEQFRNIPKWLVAF